MESNETRRLTESGSGEAHGLVVGVRALAGFVLLLVLAIVSFHPLVMEGAVRVAEVFPLMVLVLIFVYVARPVVDFVHRILKRLQPRAIVSEGRSLLMTYLLLIGFAAIALAIVVPQLVREAGTLAENLPGYANTVRDSLKAYRDRYAHLVPPEVEDRISEATSEVGKLGGDALKRGVTWVGAVSQTLFWLLGALLLVPMLGYYFLADAVGIREFLLGIIGSKHRPAVRAIVMDVHAAMQNFVKGQAILCLAIGLVTVVAMAFVLPQFAVGLAIVAGITEAIPVIGPILGAIPAIIIAFAAKGWVAAVVVGVIYLGIQQLESMFLVPRVMGESLGLHPLSLLLGMMVFGNVFGFWGVLLAAPLVATTKVLVTHLFMDSPVDATQGTSPPSWPPPPTSLVTESPVDATPGAEPQDG